MTPATPPTLLSLSYSPWSDKARWALDHCRVPYRRRAYQPLVGEPGLRLKLRRLSGPVTVPILDLGDAVLDDSFEIARYADRHAQREELRIFPAGQDDRIRHYNGLSEEALSAGRALGLRRVLLDDQALDDLLPPLLRTYAGSLGRALAAAGIRRTLEKYAEVTPADPLQTLLGVAETLRSDLAAAAPAADSTRYLLGAFSYADVVMAEALAFVEPPRTHLRLGEASRRAYRCDEVAGRFGDLLAWRDALYARRTGH